MTIPDSTLASVSFRGEVIRPLLRHRGVFELEGLDAEGEQARDELAEFLSGRDAQATRFTEQRERARARAAARAG